MLPDCRKFLPGNLEIAAQSNENNLECSSTNNAESLSPFESNQTFQNWSNLQYVPEQLEVSNFDGQPCPWNPGYYNVPAYNYYNSMAPAYDQYGFNGSYQIPPYQVTYPVPDENREVSCVSSSYSGHHQNLLAPHDRIYNQQNWDQSCSNYSGYLSNGAVDSACYQRYYPSPPQLGELSPPDSTTSEELNPACAKKKRTVVRTGRCKGRPQYDLQSNLSSSASASNMERVFIWDLDETILIFHSLLTGSYATKFQKETEAVLSLGSSMETLILELADKHLFFRDLELYDQVNINDSSCDDNGQELSGYDFSKDGLSDPNNCGGADRILKIAYRYRVIKELYSRHRTSVEDLIDPGKRGHWLTLRADIEAMTDNWLTLAKTCLELIDARGGCTNVMVTGTQLVPALAKILLFDIGKVFPIDNIYSATKVGKHRCFERIVSRFGKTNCTYVVIGDGLEEEAAAKEMTFPFWRVSSHSDIISLYNALDKGFL